MAANRQGKIQNLINYRMRVSLTDGRQLIGQMLAFDRHMNLVLADTDEFRRIKKKKATGKESESTQIESEEKRSIGLAIIRGTNIISLSVESGPPPDPSARLGAGPAASSGAPPAAMAAGPGVSRAAGRGVPSGLQGPAAGVGGPGFGGPYGGPPAMAGRGGPPFGPPGGPPGFPPQGFPGPPGGGPPGFQPPPPGFQPPPGQGRGFPPPGFGGR